MRLRSCSSWAWALVCGGTSAADGLSSWPAAGFAAGRLQSEDGARWQRGRPGKQSPALEEQSRRPEPEPGRVKVYPSNGSGQLQPGDSGVSQQTGEPRGSNAWSPQFSDANVKPRGSNDVNSLNTLPQPMKIIRLAGSFALLPLSQRESTHKITWRFLGHESELIILEYTSYNNIVSFNSYFRPRVDFNFKTGSILLKNLELEDSGLFEVTLGPTLGSTGLHRRLTFLLEVQQRLPAPQIVQSPAWMVDHVRLSCLVKSGKASSLVWAKDQQQLQNGSQVRLEFDSSTLLLGDMAASDCGLYTCTVRNQVSTNSISHFLTHHGIFFIVTYALLMSAVALVSNLTSFIAAAFIIFVALKSSLAQDHQKEFTTIFVTLQLLSFICLLIASLLSVADAGFSTGYLIIAGFGCFLGLAMIIYVSILFLSEQSLPFLSNNFHGCIILVCGPVSMVVSSLLIHKATEIAAKCRYRYEFLVVRSVIVVLVYIFPVVLFVLFYSVYIFQTFELGVKLKKVKRVSE